MSSKLFERRGRKKSWLQHREADNGCWSGDDERQSQSTQTYFFLITFSSSKFQHITPLLHRLHWLKVPERIAFKNSLPDVVTSAPSVAVFRSRLKTHLFNISYPLSTCDCTVPAQLRLVALDTIIVLPYLLTYRARYYKSNGGENVFMVHGVHQLSDIRTRQHHASKWIQTRTWRCDQNDPWDPPGSAPASHSLCSQQHPYLMTTCPLSRHTSLGISCITESPDWMTGCQMPGRPDEWTGLYA